jgi:hypothetical protein
MQYVPYIERALAFAEQRVRPLLDIAHDADLLPIELPNVDEPWLKRRRYLDVCKDITTLLCDRCPQVHRSVQMQIVRTMLDFFVENRPFIFDPNPAYVLYRHTIRLKLMQMRRDVDDDYDWNDEMARYHMCLFRQPIPPNEEYEQLRNYDIANDREAARIVWLQEWHHFDQLGTFMCWSDWA